MAEPQTTEIIESKTEDSPIDDHILRKALNICTVPALVAVEIASSPATTSAIEDMVTANLDRIKDGQLLKQSENKPFPAIDSVSYPKKLEKKIQLDAFDSPYNSLDSDQRSYNANVHIEERRTTKINRDFSPKASLSSHTGSLASSGGTNLHHTSHFETLHQNTDILKFNSPSASPVILTIIELDQLLKKLTNTNPVSNTNLELTVEKQVNDNDHDGHVNVEIEANKSLVANQTTELSSIDEDSDSDGLIPGRTVALNRFRSYSSWLRS